MQDLIFIGLIVALYATTHALVVALSRLGENRMTFVQFAMWIAGALAVYLIYALLKAEKF